MKTNSITISNGLSDPELDGFIRDQNKQLQEQVRAKARHFAKRNQPASVGDNLEHYIGECRSGYEKLTSDVFERLLPATHYNEAKVETDYYREKDDRLSQEIEILELENQNDTLELGDYDPGNIPQRIKWMLIITTIILIGEILLNIKAFQVMGDNLLVSFLIAVGVSLAVSIFSHLAPMLYKEAKTKMRRRLIVVITLFSATAFFYAIAMLRSAYFASNGTTVSPWYFVVFNLLIFIVSALLSYFFLPTWPEIKYYWHCKKITDKIQKRLSEIKERTDQKEDIRTTVLENTKLRMKILHKAQYKIEAIKKMCLQAIEIFKNTNLTYRMDRVTPDCFNKAAREMNVDDSLLNKLNRLNSKAQ